MDFLSGKKTYIVAIFAILYAISQWWAGAMPQPDAVKMILAAAAVFGFRSAFATEFSKLAAALGYGSAGASMLAGVRSGPMTNMREAAKGVAPALAIALVLGGSLFGLRACAAFGGSGDPVTQLKTYEGYFALAEATYDAICSVNAAPGFCLNNGDYAKAKIAIEALFKTAEDALAVDPTNTASIANLIPDIVADWLTYSQIVDGVQAKNAKLRGVTYRPLPAH